MQTPRRRALAIADGFSLMELVLVAALMSILAGMAMLVTPAVLARAKADSGASHLLSLLRTTREQSISQRRNMNVQFLGGNRLLVSRIDVPGPGTTVMLDTRLEQNVQFVRFPGVPDTPDLFGAGAAVDFGPATSFNFTSEGTFVDENGDELNGTIFLGLPNQQETAQAVTIFGPTGTMRAWRWTGAQWVE
jgi:prepilin-type N-terminal cleavage/methylation domain-containing protein